ncbi:MAG TPA: hypothetical protein VMU16_00595 [Candidatus Binataceae bacterium]|nr:hypothetical protein [Candidatus Binataceae bacterium]
MPYIVNGLKTVGGAASEYFAPGNPMGLSMMGSGIGGMTGQAAGGNTGDSIGSMLGGMGGMFGGDPSMGGGSMVPGAMDPTMLASGDPNSLAAMMSMAGNAGPSPAGGGGMIPGVTPAMFGGGDPSAGGMGDMSGGMPAMAGYDPLKQMQAAYLYKMMNPSGFQQTMGVLGPIGTQLMQQRQQQQLEAMRHQAPSANLQGGSNPVPTNFGGAGVADNPSSTISQYSQILAMLSR